MKRVRRVLLAALALAALSGCSASGVSPDAAGGAPVATQRVDLPKSYRFDPVAITVRAGNTVTWQNSDNFSHTVRLLAGKKMVGLMKPGEQVSYTFREPGEYRYDCSLHPQDMKGKVVVTSGSPDEAARNTESTSAKDEG